MIEIFRDKAKEYRFRVRAVNGRILVVSQGYTRKRACFKGLGALVRNLAATKAIDDQITQRVIEV
jgi:uncharacterized protein YegP (UPF0339 family)